MTSMSRQSECPHCKKKLVKGGLRKCPNCGRVLMSTRRWLLAQSKCPHCRETIDLSRKVEGGVVPRKWCPRCSGALTLSNWKTTSEAKPPPEPERFCIECGEYGKAGLIEVTEADLEELPMKESGFSRVVLGLVVLGVAVWLARTALRRDRFQPTFYPDNTDLQLSVQGPEFGTIEEARVWVERRAAPRVGGWDYEIGKNCAPLFPELPDSVLVCEETLR